MQFVVISKHSPELCPTSNGKIRKLMKKGSKEIPEIARKLGVKIVSSHVFGADHQIILIVEAAGVDPVREFLMQSRLVQWSTSTIHATWTLEEALSRAATLPAIF